MAQHNNVGDATGAAVFLLSGAALYSYLLQGGIALSESIPPIFPGSILRLRGKARETDSRHFNARRMTNE
jgi:hypothetical protein